MKLLSLGADPSECGPDRTPAIFDAASSGNCNVIAALLLSNADARCRDSTGHFPSDFVVSRGPAHTLLQVFEGKQPGQGELGHVLASLDLLLRPQVAQAVMDLAYASFMPSSGNASLQEDVSHSTERLFHPPITNSLQGLPHSAPRQQPQESALTIAARTANLTEVLMLLQNRADPNDYDALGETPLFEAVLQGQPDVIASLLLSNADVNVRSATGNTPRDIATGGAACGLLAFFAGEELREEQCEFLLDSLGNLMRTALRHEISEPAANRRGLTDSDTTGFARLPDGRPLPRPLPPLPPEVRAARDAAAQKHLSQAPLACAARAADVGEVLRLMTVGTDPNQSDDFGETPLFEAAAAGNVDAVAALLLHSADPNQKSLSGGEAADLANVPAVRTLLAFFAGAEPSTQEKWAACQSVSDPSLRAAITSRLRVGSMQEALRHTLRKLRA